MRPILNEIFEQANSFELELLYTQLTVNGSNKLKQVFEQCNKTTDGKCQLHINTKE